MQDTFQEAASRLSRAKDEFLKEILKSLLSRDIDEIPSPAELNTIDCKGGE